MDCSFVVDKINVTILEVNMDARVDSDSVADSTSNGTLGTHTEDNDGEGEAVAVEEEVEEEQLEPENAPLLHDHASVDALDPSATSTRRRKKASATGKDDTGSSDNDEEEEPERGKEKESSSMDCIGRTLQVYCALLMLCVAAALIYLFLPTWKSFLSARQPLVSCQCWEVRYKHRSKKQSMNDIGMASSQKLPPGRMCLLESTRVIQEGDMVKGYADYLKLPLSPTEIDMGFANSVDLSDQGNVIAIGTTAPAGQGDVRLLKYHPRKSRYTSVFVNKNNGDNNQRSLVFGSNKNRYSLKSPVSPRARDNFLLSNSFGKMLALSADASILVVGRESSLEFRSSIYVYGSNNKKKEKMMRSPWSGPWFGTRLPVRLSSGNRTSRSFGDRLAVSSSGNIVATSELRLPSGNDDEAQGVISVVQYAQDGGHNDTSQGPSWIPMGYDIFPTTNKDGIQALALSGDGSTVAVAFNTWKTVATVNETTVDTHCSPLYPNMNSRRLRCSHVLVYQYHSATKAWEAKGSGIAVAPFKTRSSVEADVSLALSYDGQVLAIGEPSFIAATSKEGKQALGRIHVVEYHPVNQTWASLGDPIVGELDDDQYPTGEFGASVALSNDGARLVGSTQRSPAFVGSSATNTPVSNGFVRMYELKNNRTTWNSLWEITGDIIERKFQTTKVAISGDGNSIAIATGRNVEPRGSNAVLVYRMDATTTKS